MTAADLPVGTHPRALECPHFPTRFQAVIWRNWELVAPAVLARVLGTDEAGILDLAGELGLRVPPRVNPRWLERGYVTLIRANWHLLPYAQLLDLLGWTAERMDYTLREEDFLWHKMGGLKPEVEPVVVRALTPAETERTRRLRETVRRLFPNLDAPDGEAAFEFLDAFKAPAGPPVRPARSAALRPFDLRFLYSYSALYGDPLIHPELDPYPDGTLARLAEMGINAVWLPLILYTLYPWDGRFGHYADGWERRLDSLRALTARVARFGMSVIGYLNEPRRMPLAFFRDCPELKGTDYLGNGSLCTSVPEVKALLRDGSAWLFRQVPELGGAFLITASENMTNCFSKGGRPEPPFTDCARCAGRVPAEAIAEVIRLVAEGVHGVKPEAPVIAWDWAWRDAWAPEIVDRLPEDVWLMCTSEWGLPIRTGGVDYKVADYSISRPGPSPRSLALWERARRRGLKTAAKVQLNNSWECSAVPYLPVPDLVEEHLDRLADAGVRGLMASWTLGGFPGGNLCLLQARADQLAPRLFGSAGAAVREAWRAFSAAFREFPFSVGVLYVAPQNVGPKNLLFAEPTGYSPTMVGIPYDGLAGWRSIYPVDVFEAQFERLSDGWRRGLERLRAASPGVAPEHRAAFDDLERVATAAWCHFRSTTLQVAFVRARERTDPASRARVRAVLEEERDLAVRLHDLARRDSRLGFEASNHYAYTLQDLREKALNCEDLMARWAD